MINSITQSKVCYSKWMCVWVRSRCSLEWIQSTVKSVLFCFFSPFHCHNSSSEISTSSTAEQFMFVYLAFITKRGSPLFTFCCCCWCFVSVLFCFYFSVVFSVFRFVDLAWLGFVLLFSSRFVSSFLVAIGELVRNFISWHNPWNPLQNGFL